METKEFDAVDMMHEGQRRLEARLEGMSEAEVQAFWDARFAELLQLQEKARAKRRLEPDASKR